MSDEWNRIIAQGESMHVDFKGPMEWAGRGRAALAEDIVAMANVRDGGTLLIGVAEAADGSGSVEGLTQQQASSFDPTKVCEYIASYFQPSVTLRVERPVVAGKQLIALLVSEFDTSPVICIKDGPEKPSGDGKVKRHYYAGNLIVRTSAAKSEVIRTAEDMHALIRLAVTKTSNQLLADFRRVLDGDTHTAPTLPYQGELAIWNEILRARRLVWDAMADSVGVFAMTLLPSALVSRLDHQVSRRLVQDAQVQWHGWSMPSQTFEDRFATIQNRSCSIEGTYDLEGYEEVWQLHDSGAFMFARRLHSVGDGTERRIAFEEIILAVSLGVLFAQRLYQNLLPDGRVELEFSLLGTKGLRLGTTDTFMRRVSNSYRSGEDVIVGNATASVIDLRSSWRAVVHHVVRQLFALFNWEIAPVVIDQRLDEIEGKQNR